MYIQAMLRALSCTVVVTLISCGQAAVSPSRIENDQDRLETAYAEADRLVASLIIGEARFPFQSVRFSKLCLNKTLWIYQMDVHALDDGSDTLPNRWIAAVTVWTGGNPLNAFLRGSLRLYRRESEQIRLVTTTDETPIIKEARSRDGMPSYGSLGLSITSAIEGIDSVGPARDLRGWAFAARYSYSSGYFTYLGDTICWLIQDDRFFPREARYTVWGNSVMLNMQTCFVPGADTVMIEKTICLDPWLEAADLLLAVSRGKAAVARARGMASPDDMNALAHFHDWMWDDPCRWEVMTGDRAQSCRVRFRVKRERPGMEYPEVGWLTLSLGGTAQQPKLESFQFVADETQPDWEAMK